MNTITITFISDYMLVNKWQNWGDIQYINDTGRLWPQIDCMIYFNVRSDDKSAVCNVADYDEACCAGKVQLTGWVNHLSY